MMNEWDAYSVEEAAAARTIFVDNAGITATDFHLTKDQQNELFKNGIVAATQFILEMGSFGSIPRDDGQAEQLVAWRKALTMKARGQS
jgi:hypothetical protein